MDTRYDYLFDQQQEAAVAECCVCCGEIYRNVDILLDGSPVHDECYKDYLKERTERMKIYGSYQT